MTATELVGLLSAKSLDPKRTGDGHISRCPSHEDKNPSLSVSEGGDGRILLKCHAGCTPEAITAALGLGMKDLFAEAAPRANGKSHYVGAISPQGAMVKAYDYRDAQGNVRYQNCRFPSKAFHHRQPDGKGGWIKNLKGVERVLYRLPETLKAMEDGLPVVLVEGEKDADNLAERGFASTTSGSSSSWQPRHADTLNGANVFIIADKDAAGRKYATEAAESLSGKAKSVRVLELPDLDGKAVKDATDYLDAGGTAGDLMALFDQTPEWKVEAAASISSAVKLFFDLVRPKPGDHAELLRNRFLCLGGGMLFCGPTGIGKSSASRQAAILWAIGKAFFGIEPARPLKSLIIQAENDDGDEAEIRDGIVAGLNLTAAQTELARQNILIVREDTRTSTLFFSEVVRPLLAEHKPDLLWIDPVLAYLGGESAAQKDVGAFLRNGLNPLLHEFNCAAVVIHHTNKPPTGKEKSKWQAGDFAYLAGGSAEWANWPRAVLALRSIGSHNIFELHAAKRGGRLGWLNADGSKAYTRFLGHAIEPGVICWRDVDKDEAGQGGRPKTYDVEEFLQLLPDAGLSTGDWRKLAEEECGIKSENTFHVKRRELLAAGRILKSTTSGKWQPVKKT